MISNQSSYNLATIRDLLKAAFNDKTLRRFCQDRPKFENLLTRFSASDGLADLVDKVIEYCGEFLLWEELLDGVKEARPRQYERFEPYLRITVSLTHAPPSPPVPSEPAVKEEIPPRESIPATPPPSPDIDTPASPSSAPEDQDMHANPWERVQGWWKTTLTRYWPLAVVMAIVALILATAQVYNDLTGKPFLDLFRKPNPTSLFAVTTAPTALAPIATWTPTPTNTPAPSPTLTVTPTPPLCPDVQISSLKLNLATGVGQRKDPDENGKIILEPNEIVGLQNLSGQAILVNANGCTCNWQGRTRANDPWESISSQAGDCSFSIELPDQVIAIHLMPTLGQGQTQLFTIEISER